jgi:hypothetical protein
VIAAKVGKRPGARWLAAGAVTAAVATSAPAVAQTTVLRADASASVTASSNPFLVDGGDTEAVSADLSVNGSLLIPREFGGTTVDASVRGSRYLEDYGTTVSYGVRLATYEQVSERLSFNVGASFDSFILGEQPGVGRIDLTPIAPVVPPTGGTTTPGTQPPVTQPPVVPGGVFVDPSVALLGLRQRQTTYGANGQLSYRFSSRSSLTASTGLTRNTFGDGGLGQSSFSVNGSLGYSRALNGRLSVGAQLVGSWSDYAIADSKGEVYQPQLTVNTQLSPRWSLSGSLGMLFIRSTQLGLEERTTGISGSINTCMTRERSSLCVTGSRDGQPNALGAVATQTSVSGTYSYRLDEYQAISATATYNQTSGGGFAFGDDTFSYFSASVNHSMPVTQRIHFGSSLAYRTGQGFGGRTLSDVAARVFLQARLGEIR